MPVKEIAYEAEELSLKLWSTKSLALAINDAVLYGPNDSSNFEGALHLLVGELHDSLEEADALKDKAFEVLREES